MKSKPDFLIVGSGGGGGTIAWVLASAGYDVLILEQGRNLAQQLRNPVLPFDPAVHDEELFRLRKPDPKRRLRGDYNTFQDLGTQDPARAFDGGWTGSVLGGGSVLWGTWSFRPLPIDFRLKTYYERTGELGQLQKEGYNVADWPLAYQEMMPYFHVAETLLGVSGDRAGMNRSIRESAWYQDLRTRFGGEAWFGTDAQWLPDAAFPLGAYPTTPVGRVVWDGMDHKGMHPFPTPTAIVQPGSAGFGTQAAIANALNQHRDELDGALWNRPVEQLWSNQIRQACNMCGYCGEYLCWGRTSPKWGTADTTLRELGQRDNAEIRCNAKTLEVLYDAASRRATGVAYLDLTDPDHPRRVEQLAETVIISCGAVQTARLLLLSGPPDGLGNSSGQLGHNAMFHLFGLGMRTVLGEAFQGRLHGELGPTGNTSTFDTYFVRDGDGRWIKGGHLTSAAKKNPLEDAVNAVNGSSKAGAFLDQLLVNNRTFEIRLTGDDLPCADNRVSLDPTYVDEYGVPVARISRRSISDAAGNKFVGPNEQRLDAAAQGAMKAVFELYAAKQGALTAAPKPTQAILSLVGDHQMGTCRMGEDPSTSVVNRYGRLHDVDNVFVVDSSFMPTGLGLNPMVTVVANALRVGTHIVTRLQQGSMPGH